MSGRASGGPEQIPAFVDRVGPQRAADILGDEEPPHVHDVHRVRAALSRLGADLVEVVALSDVGDDRDDPTAGVLFLEPGMITDVSRPPL